MVPAIDIRKHVRRAGVTGAIVVATWGATLGAMSAASPVVASGLYIYDSSYYRPMRGRERSTFRNPVGKLGPGVTRRLPSLTPKPAEFDFGGAGPIKIDPPAGSSAKARRGNPASQIAPLTPIPPTLTPLPAIPPPVTPPKPAP
jgi:hypothetical protein